MPRRGNRRCRRDTPIAKTCCDLAGLLFADGIHDSLYRSAGRTQTTTPIAMPVQRENAQVASAAHVKAAG